MCHKTLILFIIFIALIATTYSLSQTTTIDIFSPQIPSSKLQCNYQKVFFKPYSFQNNSLQNITVPSLLINASPQQKSLSLQGKFGTLQLISKLGVYYNYKAIRIDILYPNRIQLRQPGQMKSNIDTNNFIDESVVNTMAIQLWFQIATTNQIDKRHCYCSIQIMLEGLPNYDPIVRPSYQISIVNLLKKIVAIQDYHPDGILRNHTFYLNQPILEQIPERLIGYTNFSSSQFVYYDVVNRLIGKQPVRVDQNILRGIMSKIGNNTNKVKQKQYLIYDKGEWTSTDCNKDIPLATLLKAYDILYESKISLSMLLIAIIIIVMGNH